MRHWSISTAVFVSKGTEEKEWSCWPRDNFNKGGGKKCLDRPEYNVQAKKEKKCAQYTCVYCIHVYTVYFRICIPCTRYRCVHGILSRWIFWSAMSTGLKGMKGRADSTTISSRCYRHPHSSREGQKAVTFTWTACPEELHYWKGTEHLPICVCQCLDARSGYLEFSK